MEPKFNRRSFLKGATLTAGAAVLAVRAPSVAAQPDQPAVEPRAAAAAPVLARQETLYFNGQQWGTVNGWNPYSSDMNNAMAISQSDNARVPVFETPYMFNMLDGKVYPLLADGDYTWNAQRTQITFKIKSAAKWSDGTAVTANDVAYTWASHVKYGTVTAGNYQATIASVTAVDSKTVRVTAQVDDSGKAINPLQVAAYLSSCYVIQKAWTQKLEQRAGGDADKFRSDPALDVVSSGPYKRYYSDASIVILSRSDSYWGKDASMWGKLPVPKYLAHVIYPDTETSQEAFRAGRVDISQEYIANVQDLWLVDHLPISTYLPDAPYGIGASLPTAFFNLASYGLDQIAVRKAIAIAVDYDTIIANAMTNQSATFTQVPRSIMNPTPGEQAMYDHDAVKDLQWVGKDIEGAKKLLDDAGIIDNDHDGWREYDGKKLTYVATCPNYWTDWQAATELVAAAGKAIGIDITTLYPDSDTYLQSVTNWPLPENYDIFVMWTDGVGPTQPWGRIHHLIGGEFAQTQGNWNGNWGGYQNPLADDFISAIPAETDAATLKDLYTRLTEIYLTDIPSFTLMYRPQEFHTMNHTVWTGYPVGGDGKNIPPLLFTDGYSIAGLYTIELNEPNHLYVPMTRKP